MFLKFKKIVLVIEYKIVFYHFWLNDHDQRGIFGIDEGIFGINEFIFGINDHDLRGIFG